MSVRSLPAALLLAVGLSSTPTVVAEAHPLGNFSVNRYARIEIGPERTTLRYVLDLAEIPTLQELQSGGIAADASEDAVARALLPARAALIAERARLAMGARWASWEVRDASLTLPEGQAGLRTMRVALTLVASLTVVPGDAVSYRDGNEPGRTGWHEVVLRGIDGVAIEGSSVPARDMSDELRRYPADPLAAPPDVSSASGTARVTAVASGTGPSVAAGASRFGIDAIADGVAGLIRAGAAGDLVATLLALIAAAGVGAAHAITPGHGKTVMAAYLVGTRGTARRALVLGGVVALSHTAGVLGLGLVTLGMSTVVAPDRLYPVLSAVSAVVVLGIGLRLIAGLRRAQPHDHANDHDHAHEHDHGSARVGWRSLVALGISGGLVPSASALLLLLAAVSLRRPELGVILVVAFGLGMAAVLVGIGLTLVGAARLAAGRLAGSRAARRAASLVPALTAAAVLVVGAGLSLQAGQQLLSTFL